jgi:hypothetical protein
LREEFIPEVEREIWVRSAQAGDEVILKSANSAFGGVAAMIAGGDELVVDLLAVHVGFEHGRGFVVKPLEFGLEAAGFEEELGTCVGSGVFFFGAVFHELGMDEV